MEIRAYDGTVTIRAPASLAPFDLVADTVDVNGLPLNPKWGAQWTANVRPDYTRCPPGTIEGDHDPGVFPCTNQFTYVNRGGLLDCGLHNPGHVNWFGATYEGNLFWSHLDDDGDYNLWLTRQDEAGYTRFFYRVPAILCEFDSRETVRNFDPDPTRWWFRFRAAVGNSDAIARLMIDGSFAIVTALMGLDCEHNCWSELHPVWAMAANVQPSVDDDLWVFFARNWGNEGACGPDQEFIEFPNDTYTVRLPWRAGATSVRVRSQSFHAYHTQRPPPTVRSVPGVGVFVTFMLDAPRWHGSMWDGELRLQWSGSNLTVAPRAKGPASAERPRRQGGF